MTKEQIDAALAVSPEAQAATLLAQVKNQISQAINAKAQLPTLKSRLETTLAQPNVIAAAGSQLATLQEIVAGI